LKEFARIRGGEPTQYEAREVIPVLLNILNVYPDKSHENIIAATLLILSILAYNKDINQLYIRRHNGGPVFVDLLDFPITSIKSRAALALAAYSLNNTLIKKESAPAVKKLLAILTNNTDDESLKMSACAALTSLADGHEGNQKLIKKQNGLKLILHLIASNQIPPKYALNLLAALVHNNKSNQNMVRELHKGLFRKIVRLLSPYTKPRILQAAVHALVELSMHNADNKKQVAKAGAVPFLVNILTNKTQQTEQLIAGALYLCWASSKYLPNKLNDAEFRNPKGGIREVLLPLRELKNAHVLKVIAQIDAKLNKQAPPLQ